jgi:uncharacterized membrane protein YphA (DoxX/SURF4 family)
MQLLKSSYRIGLLAVLAILGLRLAIGWHFYREGADKLVSGEFSSAGFMKVAKGPLTPLFHWFVWDLDGRARLDREGTLDAWNQYRERVAAHFGFDEKQAAKASEVLKFRERQYVTLLDDNAADIDTYFRGLERRDKYRREAGRMEVASLRGQVETIERELVQALNGWLSSIDAMWEGLENDLNALATPEQGSRGHLALGKPGRKLMDTIFIDQIIPTFDLIVGILLILGLFTRITSLAGAGFLAMIVATQWPGAPGAIPAHYQIIEMFGCLVLAAVGAGRFAGLDFLVDCLLKKCCPPKTEKK